MPTYKFQCSEHGWWKKMMSISEYERLKENNFEGICPEQRCMNECEPVMGTPRVEFNTTGFYYTDKDPKATNKPAKEEHKIVNEKHVDKEE